jgi:hypothetical protein
MDKEYFHSTEDGHILNTLMENVSAFKKIFAYNASLLKDYAPAACVYKMNTDDQSIVRSLISLQTLKATIISLD